MNQQQTAVPRDAMVARGNLNPNKGGDACHF